MKPENEHKLPIPKNLPEKYLKPYNSVAVEDGMYHAWNESGFFNPDKLPARYKDVEPFSMVLPPPNVTGVLHMGSALMLAIEDIMARYARMKGLRTLWIPGTDHAAIATQSVVEKKIQKEEGKSRHDLGREELLKRVDAYAHESHDSIVLQMRKMGASLDWSREAFTLDEKRNLAVRTAFKQMFDDGLIYRGYRVVNWDPKGQTTISDDEIVYETRPTVLYTFKYSKDIPISISTTRPETKLGDTAIAVHPDDVRYKKYVGQEFKAIFAGEPITLKVIGDQNVDPAFGTGALGVTPAHSAIDWEMGQKHGLPLKQVINEYAKMMVGMDGVKDKKTTDARQAVVEWLKNEKLLEKEENIEHNISLAERTGGVIEPLPKLQWFVAADKPFTKNGKTTTLKKLMIDAVKSGETTIVPPRFEKVYFHWIENLRDWCISRQIWYGHRVPVWYCLDCDREKFESFFYDSDRQTTKSGIGFIRTGDHSGNSKIEPQDVIRAINDGHMVLPDGLKPLCIGEQNPDKCSSCSGKNIIQDFDTLDTWFSSGLWTFSTLGWPDEKEFARHRAYHPTTMLETGSDILFFWVARMILMSTYLIGEVPFKTVYLHGLVRDTKGRKISKSLGNNIDPLDMIAKYGADAVRMSLVVGVGPGNDSKIDENKIKAYKLFTNKLWNITRFVLSGTEGVTYDPKFTSWTTTDAAHMQKFNEFIAEVTKEMDEYKFYLVAEKLYQYVWHEFADKILEESKALLTSNDSQVKNSRAQLLYTLQIGIVKLLHPFMPFVTEEIWKDMPIKDKEMLMVTSYR